MRNKTGFRPPDEFSRLKNEADAFDRYFNWISKGMFALWISIIVFTLCIVPSALAFLAWALFGPWHWLAQLGL